MTSCVQSLHQCPVPSLQYNSQWDDWVWDISAKSPEVQLSANQKAAYFHNDPVLESTGTAGVRGTEGFSDGEHYWEAVFTAPLTGTSVMVGVGTEKALLHMDNYRFVDLLGLDDQSWGLSYRGKIRHGGQSHRYCEPFYYESTVIGVHLDLYEGVLTFYKDGVSLGPAFHGLNKVQGKLYPMVSSTSPETELEVRARIRKQPTLQQKCFMTVARSLKRKADSAVLPLPTVMKKQIVYLT